MVVPPTLLLLRRAGFGGALAVIVGALTWLSGTCAAAGGNHLVAMALGGALGGVVFHYLEPLRQHSRAWRIAADVAGALGYLVIVGVALVLAAGGACCELRF
jgi:hypothetical protein